MYDSYEAYTDIVEYVAKSELPSLDGAKVWFTFDVMQSTVYGFVGSCVRRLTRDVSVTLSHADAEEITDVWSASAFLAEKQVRIVGDIPGLKTVKADGWVLPKGVTVFSWTSPIRIPVAVPSNSEIGALAEAEQCDVLKLSESN